MKNEVFVFNNPQFGQIRTMTDEKGEPWFCGKDVAEALGYAKPRDAIMSHVEEEDKKVLTPRNTALEKLDKLPNRGTAFINESGLYALILSSKLPQAREFKRWVTTEVLPSIRKQGGYMLTKQTDTPETILSRAILIAKTTIDNLVSQNATLTLNVQQLQPKADYTDTVLRSVDCLTTTQVAKELGFSARKLNQLLCQCGVQFFSSGQCATR